MPDITDPKVVAFYSENFHKEKKLKLKWFYRNIDSINDSATIKNKNVLSETEALKEKFKAEMSDLKVYKKTVKPDLALHDLAKPQEYVYLKPVDPEQRNLLYSSNIGEGRVNYLRKRFKMNPEDKFYFPECTSWDYGWDLKNANTRMGKRAPRVEIVHRSFYRNNGVGVDPPHYKEPAGATHSVCG